MGSGPSSEGLGSSGQSAEKGAHDQTNTVSAPATGTEAYPPGETGGGPGVSRPTDAYLIGCRAAGYADGLRAGRYSGRAGDSSADHHAAGYADGVKAGGQLASAAGVSAAPAEGGT